MNDEEINTALMREPSPNEVEISKIFRSHQALVEACEAALKFWEEHQYDTMKSGDGDGEEFNVYDEEPEMVAKIKQALKLARGEG